MLYIMGSKCLNFTFTYYLELEAFLMIQNQAGRRIWFALYVTVSVHFLFTETPMVVCPSTYTFRDSKFNRRLRRYQDPSPI